MDENERLRAAYALNLWTVSVSQIVDYNDINILKQEYDNIMNNLNLENMPKDETLLDVIKQIMDQISYALRDEGDRLIAEKEYNHRLKNAIWSAVPNVGAIFASSNPVVIGLTLATQVGMGYMNYRRNKAEIELNYEKSRWEIARNTLMHINALKKQLFETAWRLADKYNFPDQYRLTDRQIQEYNKVLIENEPIKRYIALEGMEKYFSAYPQFWYQFGSTANCIYNEKGRINADTYKQKAIECFKKYKALNKFNLLRNDIITSSWALEYIELLGTQDDKNKTRELIEIAERHSGDAPDILELCAFDCLKINDTDNAVRLFRQLVNKKYNSEINTQILSGLYIKNIRSFDISIADKAQSGYNELMEYGDPRYILPIPDKNVDLSDWHPEWIKEHIESKENKMETSMSNETNTRKYDLFVVYPEQDRCIADKFESMLKSNKYVRSVTLYSDSQAKGLTSSGDNRIIYISNVMKSVQRPKNLIREIIENSFMVYSTIYGWKGSEAMIYIEGPLYKGTGRDSLIYNCQADPGINEKWKYENITTLQMLYGAVYFCRHDIDKFLTGKKLIGD